MLRNIVKICLRIDSSGRVEYTTTVPSRDDEPGEWVSLAYRSRLEEETVLYRSKQEVSALYPSSLGEAVLYLSGLEGTAPYRSKYDSSRRAFKKIV